MSTLALYFHTVRYLRPVQIAGRLQQYLPRSRPDLRAPPPVRMPGERYIDPIEPAPTLLGPATFRFMNLELPCSRAEDWQRTDAPRLWTYNLHYFDDLNAVGARQRTAWQRELLERWTRENPPGRGAGWEPYPLSRRIVNWVKWALRGNPLPLECRNSLAVQARWLVKRLEYHLLGNHLFANAKALIHAGLYFEGVEAERWLARGMEVASKELHEQVLGDGGHFELSTMYHAAALEDLFDLLNIARVYDRTGDPQWESVARRMLAWLSVMTHPDGDISFFNDAAIGIAPPVSELERYAVRLGLSAHDSSAEPLTVLPSSRYVRAISGAAYLICDCADIGPDYLPGHAHADTLSFELSLHGQRTFVNSGTSEYAAGPERQRQRGSAAHNTVVIDGYDSSEVWGSFRVARRARVCLHRTVLSSDAIVVEASHDGYKRLRGRNLHRRSWVLDNSSLRIDDHISGAFSVAETYWHLHPAVNARLDRGGQVKLALPGGRSVNVSFDGAKDVSIRPSTWHPHFGVAIPNQCVVTRLARPSLSTWVQWGNGG